MSILLAVNDGIVNNNWDEADVSFLIGLVLGCLAAIAYAAGVGTVLHREDPPTAAEGIPKVSTTTTPPAPTTWYAGFQYRAHQVAAALMALAVAAVALGLFLQ